MSPRDYVIEQKMLKAKELLHSTNMSISEISTFVGYENFSKMSSRFKMIYGLTPTEFRESIDTPYHPIPDNRLEKTC